MAGLKSQWNPTDTQAERWRSCPRVYGRTSRSCATAELSQGWDLGADFLPLEAAEEDRAQPVGGQFDSGQQHVCSRAMSHV